VLGRTLRQWGYEVEQVGDGDAAAAALSRPDSPEIAILDWMMPGLDGPEVCRRVRAAGAEPYRYLILLTSKSGRDDLVDGLNAGADEYLSKPFEPTELRARLRVAERLIDLQWQLIEARDALHHQATRDGLTGALNRRAALDSLRDELARARRKRSGVGLVMLDLDHFKRVNDTLGHLAGDAVLIEAAQRMCQELRTYDQLGRFGGEEFVVVVPDTDPAGAASVAERMREVIAGRPVWAEGHSVHVTASLGVAWTPGDAEADDLVREADEALYAAKRAGRDRVELGPSCRGPAAALA
jgi:two-component system cell cycle response regulator